MNLAYVISAYRLPELLVRLVRRLESPRATFYIHVDARTSEAVYRRMTAPLSDRHNVRFLPRHACYWGDFGHVRVSLKGLRAALDAEQPFDYVVLLTGQDYPLVPNAEIEARLEAAGGQVFMEHFPLPSPRWTGGGLDRIEHRQRRLGERFFRIPGQPFRNAVLASAWRLATKPLLRRFPDGLTPYGGSSYWMMPLDCARYVLDYVDAHPDVLRFFQQTAIPDEMLFQTVVLNSPFRARVSQESHRFIDWSGDGDSPSVLTSDRFEEVMASGKLFARKVDPTVDAQLLDRIDHALDSASAPG